MARQDILNKDEDQVEWKGVVECGVGLGLQEQLGNDSSVGGQEARSRVGSGVMVAAKEETREMVQ